jgi:UDP:flavonoid glycosyltransferase YjiC (YdhE family)
LANVIFTSVGSGGDVLPFLTIGRRLKGRGHDVTLISHCYYRSAAEGAGLHFAALDNEEQYACFINDEPLLNTPRSIPEFLRRHSLPKILLEYEMIRQRYHARDTVLVTRDLFDTAARISAEKLGVPLLAVFFAPSQITTRKIRVELFSTYLACEINRIRAEVGLLPVSEWDSWLGYPDPSIALWPDWFAPSDSAWPAGIVPVGFMPDDDVETAEIPEDVQVLLTSGEAPILITGGTGTYLGPEFYTVSSEACRLLNRPGILITRHQEQVPKFLPDSIHRFSYLPFRKLMAHVGVVIHHGGRGTLSCAMAAGVPQLVLAMGADRPDNAARLRQLGVAEVEPPPRWKPDLVAAALDRLINSSLMQDRCKELASRLRDCDSAAVACKLIEEVAGS